MTYESQEQRLIKQFGPTASQKLSEAEAAWLAGVIDGEGCIGIWRQRNPKLQSGYSYRASLQVTNTNLQFVARVRELIDGYVTVDQHPKNVNPKHKVLYRALVNQRAVAAVLEEILPYLIIKKRQAEVVLQFCRVVNSTLVKDGQDHEAYEQLYLECKALNKRGPLT